ncbi:MAG: CoB--CoM heterodisulfide reductase iron-sulfur subunit A family protein [Candidatus Cloacimonadota bacterium]|nr:MAG: CoB--CoM heterodisulfide reductase iron-sulfur subunit A family protein [Candidatus Cloacimonadota bacterium]
MNELRIGVFVCKCGSNIAGFIDVPAVAEYAKGLPGVVFARHNLYSCSESGTQTIKDSIREHNLNRVVVAACTPRTHEPVFRAACEDEGLNQFLFEFVNIREHCSWVHMQERELATQKAKELVRMGVARVALLEPGEMTEVEVIPSALVIGGGISGITAATALGSMGLKVILAEREKELGGMLNDLYKLYPTGEDAREFLDKRIKTLKKFKNVEILTSSEIKDIEGYIGNYNVIIKEGKKEKDYKVGTIILATGALTYKPKKVSKGKSLFNYDGKNVITQIQLENRLIKGLKEKKVVMIQCAGSRVPERIYCSRICCMTAIKNGMLLKKANKDAEVTILYRDLQTYGTDYEDELREAKKAGVKFIRYSKEKPPSVDKKKKFVSVHHELLGRNIEIPFDLVVLSTPLIAHSDVKKLSQKLKVPVDEHGFFLEAHVKLRPLEFATDGVFICGCAHWPADITESISQALGATSKAAIPLLNLKVTVEPIISYVDEEKCTGCGICEENCPYAAITKDPETKKAKVTEVICKGCGICASNCPEQAIDIKHYKDEQFSAQLKAAFEEVKT